MQGSWTKSLTATQSAKFSKGQLTARIMIIGQIIRVREQGSDADLAGVALAEAAAQDLRGDVLGRAAAGLRDGLPLLVLAQPELHDTQKVSAHSLPRSKTCGKSTQPASSCRNSFIVKAISQIGAQP